MDSSPPSAGVFAVRDDHTTGVEIHLDGWMTWAVGNDGNCVLNLAWFGFTDRHSEISHYYLIVGSQYNLADLTDVSSATLSKVAVSAFHISCKLLSFTLENS